MNAANMVRSLLPLVLICLVIVGWTSFRQSADVSRCARSTHRRRSQLAAARASYPMRRPAGAGRRATGRPARAPTPGNAPAGDPVTLEIGYADARRRSSPASS